MPNNKVVAILVADIHLALKPPVARRDEYNWFDAMKRSLYEIDHLSRRHNCPILCAGDVFDRWNSPPELINFAIDNLPQMFSIPGQHDLPLHRIDLTSRSAYGTLCRAGRIADAPLYVASRVGPNLWVKGFPWGVPLTPCSKALRRVDGGEGLRVALVHSFLWLNKETSYPGAPESGRVSATQASFEGWDAVVFGDNHKGFLTCMGGTSVLNCGTVFRRRTDEKDYKPHVGLLMRDGQIVLHYLDTSEDVLTVPEKDLDAAIEACIVDFVSALQSMAGEPLDFEAAMDKAMRKCTPGVREILTEIMA